MFPAVPECVLNICKRHLGMSVWQPVHDNADRDTALVHPFGHIFPFLYGADCRITTSRANHNHLSVWFLREVEFHSCFVADQAYIAVLVARFGFCYPIGLTRPESDRLSILNNPFVRVLPFRIKKHSLVGLGIKGLGRDSGECDRFIGIGLTALIENAHIAIGKYHKVRICGRAFCQGADPFPVFSGVPTHPDGHIPSFVLCLRI